MCAQHVPTLYVRVVDVVFGGAKLNAGTASRPTASVRAICNPVPLKLDSQRKDVLGRVVSFEDDFFFQLVDLDSLELRILVAEGDGSPAIHGSVSLEMRDVRDNVCQDLWLKLQRSGGSSTALGGASTALVRDLQQQQRSPRKPGAAAGGGAGDAADLGELHVRVFAARASDEAAAEKRLVEPTYAAVVSVLSRAPFRDSIYLCSVAPQTAGDKVAASLVTVLQRAHVVLPFIRAVVEQEVSSTASSSVLFRSNSMAIRVLSAYGRVAGDGYLRSVLGDLVRDVCADTTSYEPDPSIVAPAQAAANTAHIAKLSEKFLAHIMASEAQFPASFRVICNDVRRIVGQKFSDFWARAVGGFFFLRFVCPAIASPTTTGLLDPSVAVTVNKNARRVLILVTKVLQNVANQTTFNEAWMQPLDRLAQEQSSLVEAFLDRVSRDPPSLAAASTDAVTTTPAAMVAAIEDLCEVFRDDAGGGASAELSAALKAVVPRGRPFAQLPPQSDAAVVLPTTGPRPFWDVTTLPAQVMNATTWLGAVRDAETVAGSLAATATLLIRRQLERDAEKGPFEEGVFVDWKALRLSTDFADFDKAMSELHHVRLDALGADARLAFWLNTLNCMSFVVQVLSAGKGSAKGAGDALFAVAGHLFTCDDVAYGVLRGGNQRLAAKGASAGVVNVSASSKKTALLLKADDPRRVFITAFDSKINFCITTFAWDSPVLRPYDRDPNCIRRAASVYCDKFLQTDLSKMEVVVPKLLEENRFDWAEEDNTQRVLQLVQFVTARKLEILQTLTNPKCSITVSKAKGPAHPIYWLSQMRLDEKARLEEKAKVQASPRGTGTAAPATDEPSPRKRADLSDSTKGLESSAGGGGGAWQRVQRSSSTAPDSSGTKIPPLQLMKRGATAREPRARVPLSPGPGGAAPPLSPGAGGSSNTSSGDYSPPSPKPSDGTSTNSPFLAGAARRSPRSPRVSAKAVFDPNGVAMVAPVRSSVSSWEDGGDDAAQSDKTRIIDAGQLGGAGSGRAALEAPTSPSLVHSAAAAAADAPAGASDPLVSPRIPPKPAASAAQLRLNRKPSESSVVNLVARKSPMAPGTPLAPPQSVPSASPPLPPPPPVPADAAAAGAAVLAHEVDTLREELAALLVEAMEIVDLDGALSTGKMLTMVRRQLMLTLGWTEMPAGIVHPLPDVELSRMQRRFLPEAKQPTFIKLFQAFHSGVMDLGLILNEMLGLAALSEREADLLKQLRDASEAVRLQTAQLEAARLGDSERAEVLHMEDVLAPELHAVLGTLSHWAKRVADDQVVDREGLLVVMLGARALLALNGSDSSSGTAPAAAVDFAGVSPRGPQPLEPTIASLIAKFGLIEKMMRSPKATSSGLMVAVLKTQQIKAYLDEKLVDIK